MECVILSSFLQIKKLIMYKLIIQIMKKKKIFYEKNFIQTLIQHIRYYMLQENEFYSFSELQQFELLQSYQDDALSSVEVQELFLNEIKNIEKDIIDLQKEYQNKKRYS